VSLEDNETEATILSKIDQMEAEATGTPPEASPEEPEGQVEQQEQVEQAEEPAIEPPPTWKAELKDKWSALPRDLQQSLAQWETERNQGFNSKLNESAEAKKVAETVKAQAEQERQRYAQQLDSLIQQATALDPVLAQASKMTAQDWEQAWKTNPAETGLFKQQVENRIGQIQAWQSQQQQLKEQQLAQLQSAEHQKLLSKVPEWSDETKRTQLEGDLSKTLKDVYGFTPPEIAKVYDHRHVLVALDAMRYRQMMAAKDTAQTKKVVPVQKVVKPGAAQDQRGESPRVKALKQRAQRSGRMEDQVNAVLAAIGD